MRITFVIERHAFFLKKKSKKSQTVQDFFLFFIVVIIDTMNPNPVSNGLAIPTETSTTNKESSASTSTVNNTTIKPGTTASPGKERRIRRGSLHLA